MRLLTILLGICVILAIILRRKTTHRTPQVSPRESREALEICARVARKSFERNHA